MEKLWQQWSVFDVLSAHMEKETDCLTNAKSTRGICAFLGKVVLCCDCNKDSVFNFSSSRVPKGRWTWHGLNAWFLLTLKSLE